MGLKRLPCAPTNKNQMADALLELLISTQKPTVFSLIIILLHSSSNVPVILEPMHCVPKVRVFNLTVNNISVISRLSVLLVEETGVPGENHRPAANHRQT